MYYPLYDGNGCYSPTNLTQIVQITSLSRSRTSRLVRSQMPQWAHCVRLGVSARCRSSPMSSQAVCKLV